MGYSDTEVAETLEDLLVYANALKILWAWRKDELGQFDPDYCQLEQKIDQANALLAWLFQKIGEQRP